MYKLFLYNTLIFDFHKTSIFCRNIFITNTFSGRDTERGIIIVLLGKQPLTWKILIYDIL